MMMVKLKDAKAPKCAYNACFFILSECLIGHYNEEIIQFKINFCCIICVFDIIYVQNHQLACLQRFLNLNINFDIY